MCKTGYSFAYVEGCAAADNKHMVGCDFVDGFNAVFNCSVICATVYLIYVDI